MEAYVSWLGVALIVIGVVVPIVAQPPAGLRKGEPDQPRSPLPLGVLLVFAGVTFLVLDWLFSTWE